MNKLFLLILMVFLHIIDDYNLQGWLASAKQQEWWKNNAPSKLYKYDYIWALITHSFSWSFMIMLPIALNMRFNIDYIFMVILFANVFIHAFIDDLKANKKKINLWTDQIIHVMQIIITFFILV